MILLDALTAGSFPDGTRLSDSSSSMLAEASLESVHFSVARHSPPEGSDRVAKILESAKRGGALARFANSVLRRVERRADQGLPERPRRLLNAIDSLEACRDELVGKAPERPAFLDGYLHSLRGIAVRALIADDQQVGEMTHNIAERLAEYRDFGTLHAPTLATALAQDIRSRAIVRGDVLVQVRLHPDATLDVCPPKIAMSAFLAGMGRPDLADIEGFERNAMSVLSAAEVVAERTRTSRDFSKLVVGTQIAHLLFAAATTSLGWVLRRYEKAGRRGSSDLAKEHQVAEENRVETLATLDSTFGSLITEPITHALGQLMLAGDQPLTNAVLAKLIRDGVARNPIYPTHVARLWEVVIDKIRLEDLAEDAEQIVWELPGLLQGRIREKFAESFSDSHVYRAAAVLQERWYFPSMSYENSAEGYGL